MNMPKHLLPTTVVGSYPQPEWLVDRAMLSKCVPRTRMHAMWRLPEEHLEEAQDDATIVAIEKPAQVPGVGLCSSRQIDGQDVQDQRRHSQRVSRTARDSSGVERGDSRRRGPSCRKLP